MPTLLLEIGCEELPARACREAEAQLPELAERELGRRARPGARRAAAAGAPRSTTCPTRTPDEWVEGPARVALDARRRGRASRRGTASRSTSSSARDGFLGVERAGRSRSPRCSRSGSTRSCAGSRSRSRCAGTTSGHPLPAAGALAAREAGRRRRVVRHRRTLVGPPLHARRGRGPDARRATSSALREAGRRARRRGAPRGRSSTALDAIGGWSDPGRQARGGRPPRREAASCSRAASTSASSQLPERVVVTAMQSHQRYFPLGGDRVRVRRERRRPGARARRATSACSRAGSRTRRSRSSATSRAGSRRWPSGSARSRSSRARARSPTRPSGCASSSSALGGGEASLEAARLAKADQAAELVREFPDLEGYIGAEYARLAGFPEAVVAAIEEQYLPDAAGGPLPQTEAGKVLAAADKLDTLDGRVRARPPADRLARPVRAAARGDRPLPARGRGRVSSIAARPARRRRRATSSRSGSRACSTCRSSSCAPRGRRRRRPRRRGAAGPGALARARDAASTASTRRTSGAPARRARRRRSRAPSVDPALLEEDAEVALARAS